MKKLLLLFAVAVLAGCSKEGEKDMKCWQYEQYKYHMTGEFISYSRCVYCGRMLTFDELIKDFGIDGAHVTKLDDGTYYVTTRDNLIYYLNKNIKFVDETGGSF